MYSAKNTPARFAFYSAVSLTILTIITFGLAMLAVPPSGPFCQENCMEYPYSELLNYYPRDYYWMYLAIFQLFAFITFIVSVHQATTVEKKVFSSLSKSFALIAAIVLLIAYYTQFAVVPVSMMRGETEGIALFTQYNGNGLFIALEELGYIAMAVSLFFLAPTFHARSRFGKAIRIVFAMPLVLAIISFIYFSLKFGIERSYRFEVAVIAIDWIFLIAGGILSIIHFRRLSNQ